MRQRLALAGALLGDPRVLVLDEPANGLDPQGIRWLREFLRWFSARGNAVLVSSHLLSEMDQMADEVVVIDHGRLVRQGAVADLTGGRSSLRVSSPDHEALARALIAAGLEPRRRRCVRGGRRLGDLIGEIALQAGVAAQPAHPREITLEDAFLELTEGADR